MEKLVDTHELERELRATLSAQREIGPNYEHQLVENFMQKVNRQGLMPAVNQDAQTLPNLALGLRLALAILSLIFMIPLAAITTSSSDGLAALFVVSLVVLGINLAFNRHR